MNARVRKREGGEGDRRAHVCYTPVHMLKQNSINTSKQLFLLEFQNRFFVRIASPDIKEVKIRNCIGCRKTLKIRFLPTAARTSARTHTQYTAVSYTHLDVYKRQIF